MQDEKKFDESDDESTCDQEALVHDNGNDFRQKVYESGLENEPIIQCIGQLRISYRYSAPQSYNIKMIGTATVFAANANNQKVFAITCAHNLRRHIFECADCGQYMELKKNRQLITQCINCFGKNLQKKTIEATQVQFQRRSIKKKYYKGDDEKEEVVFGDVINTYNNIQCEYINDRMYERYYLARNGYDLAVISFIDAKRFYFRFCDRIKVSNATTALDKNANEAVHFNLFGYPGDKLVNDEYQMWGMQSSGTDYWIQKCEKTHNEYLKHREIDSVVGQSGSSIWYVDDSGNNVIFAIHSGGNAKQKFNVGTLLSKQNVINIQLCCPLLHDTLIKETMAGLSQQIEENDLYTSDAISAAMQSTQIPENALSTILSQEYYRLTIDYKLKIDEYFMDCDLSQLIPIVKAAKYDYLEDLICKNHDDFRNIISIFEKEQLCFRDKRCLKKICLRPESWINLQNEKRECFKDHFLEMCPLMIEFLNKICLLSYKHPPKHINIVDTMDNSFNASGAKQRAQIIAMDIEATCNMFMIKPDHMRKCLIALGCIIQYNEDLPCSIYSNQEKQTIKECVDHFITDVTIVLSTWEKLSQEYFDCLLLLKTTFECFVSNQNKFITNIECLRFITSTLDTLTKTVQLELDQFQDSFMNRARELINVTHGRKHIEYLLEKN